MYSGKYAKKSNKSRKRLRKSKPPLLFITLVILLGVLVGSTVAYLVANTGSIANSFVPAKITTDITEDFDGNVKNNVQLKNTGEVDAFVRAAVVITWQNAAGEVYPTAPVVGTDYTVKRVNPNAVEKDTCTYCGQRQGYDYSITSKIK